MAECWVHGHAPSHHQGQALVQHWVGHQAWVALQVRRHLAMQHLLHHDLVRSKALVLRHGGLCRHDRSLHGGRVHARNVWHGHGVACWPDVGVQPSRAGMRPAMRLQRVQSRLPELPLLWRWRPPRLLGGRRRLLPLRLLRRRLLPLRLLRGRHLGTLLLQSSRPLLLGPPLGLLLLLLLLTRPARALVLSHHSLHSALLLLAPSFLRRPLAPRRQLLLLARRLPQLRHRPCSLIPVSPWRHILPWRILPWRTLPWRTLPLHHAGWSCRLLLRRRSPGLLRQLLSRRSPGLLRLLQRRLGPPAGRRRLQRRCSTPGRPCQALQMGGTASQGQTMETVAC